ncbi:threonine aldolase family protein [Membranihabitans maritimus]|uniref:threonine aldolase family protein n=1 Tax=Membranihabitans maritimus TaxID=2904244 RepID=UPI001F02F1A8|nr:GntG family PLP-dependent aldolase [Membranihabitans maritimus]
MGKNVTIDLRSDTVTKPTQKMLNAMLKARVGDDVFREDPTVNQLEEKIANLFGMEASLFCPSGTMANQLAIKLHTSPLDEMICASNAHVLNYESAGYSFLSGISYKGIDSSNGKINPIQIEESIRQNLDWLPESKLVTIENTTNMGGGTYYTLSEASAISALCRAKGLKFHIDGARIFNALVETGESPSEWGKIADTISVCLSKGLGAPVGSLLLGTSTIIQKARKIRKVLGGGMRQVGFLAAAGIYALDNNIKRLEIDHKHILEIANTLRHCSLVKEIKPPATNILVFKIAGMPSARFVKELEQVDIFCLAIDSEWIRIVTHLGITKEMIHTVKNKIATILS